MSEADGVLPAQLASAADCKHIDVPRDRFQMRLAEEWDEHTAGHNNEVDRELYARGQFHPYADGDLVLRGGCFEIGRCFYWSRFGDVERPTISDWSMWFLENEKSRDVQLLDAWFNSLAQAPMPQIDWRDRFYWEQRLAGWLSSGEQGLDLVAAEKVHPANCIDVFELLLALEPDIRKAGLHQQALTARMAPALSEFPLNPPSGRAEKLSEWRKLLLHCIADPGYTRRLAARKWRHWVG
jgi:hypothetical protein